MGLCWPTGECRGGGTHPRAAPAAWLTPPRSERGIPLGGGGSRTRSGVQHAQGLTRVRVHPGPGRASPELKAAFPPLPSGRRPPEGAAGRSPSLTLGSGCYPLGSWGSSVSKPGTSHPWGLAAHSDGGGRAGGSLCEAQTLPAWPALCSEPSRYLVPGTQEAAAQDPPPGRRLLASLKAKVGGLWFPFRGL